MSLVVAIIVLALLAAALVAGLAATMAGPRHLRGHRTRRWPSMRPRRARRGSTPLSGGGQRPS